MKYIGTPNFQHGTEEHLGVLVVNLGTPEAPETGAVRRYLAEFLSDPRIIELPRWLWNIILHGIILRIRPSRSAKAYREVWSDDTGSPLLSISKQQTAALSVELQQRFPGQEIVVELGIRYGNPSIDSAIENLAAANVRRLIVLPMYPQYSGTTTASVFDAVTSHMQKTRWIPELRFINQFCDQSDFSKALANSVRESWEENGRGDLLVTSYHGIPKRYLTSGDPYHCLCHKTTRLMAQELGLNSDQYRVVFQSRVGREEWLRPYCDETMKGLASEGIKSIDVMSPAFSADCLETIEEICGENREYFEENGGERFQYIPCLNDRPEHINVLADLVVRHAQGWPETDKTRNTAIIQSELQTSAKQATQLMENPPAKV
jgi:ferrochelatase